ncbi:unnamed protein product [Rhizoctonia solani]|uniref:Uncharacterized protein n=1 Tax=Rhizoctonia solani TaxID=456999 RepID=A0A8H3A306_9AGAM|nr:unnamed protein product [Rhizoctonia solani]CAE6493145.1 unnamed protein product [Rhizoctonia solani]
MKWRPWYINTSPLNTKRYPVLLGQSAVIKPSIYTTFTQFHTMKSIFALIAGFVMLTPAVLASPATLERRCSAVGGECGTGYMLPDCCGTNRCDYGPGVNPNSDYNRGKMLVGHCVA